MCLSAALCLPGHDHSRGLWPLGKQMLEEQTVLVWTPAPALCGYGQGWASPQHIVRASNRVWQIHTRNLLLTATRKILEISNLLNLSDKAPTHSECGSPVGSTRTQPMLPPPSHPTLPSPLLLQPSHIISKTCQGKVRQKAQESGEKTGVMIGEISHHLWFCTKTHYINYQSSKSCWRDLSLPASNI